MNIKARLKKIELSRGHKLTQEEIEERLEAFIEVETLVKGRSPTAEEIEAERKELSKLPRHISQKEMNETIAEVEKLWDEIAAADLKIKPPEETLMTTDNQERSLLK